VSSGGVPQYTGSGVAGVYPVYNGSGGIGGTPIYAGTVTGGGGYPMYTGMGGATTMWPSYDAGPTTNFCVSATGPACGDYCVPIFSGQVDGGIVPTDAGALEPSMCYAACGSDVRGCSSLVYQGQLYIHCQSFCIGGRRPDGLTAGVPSCDNELGAYFESMARLETASVPAFRTLKRELAHYGAPKKLHRSALVAARDEVRHARATRALARRFGGRIVPPLIESRPRRSLEALALENAVEGCVRETFGAMMATWQAAVSSDPEVRAEMRRIARDETRHAALALRVAKWAERKLDVAARRRVADAKRAAVVQVFAELEYDLSPDVAQVAGVPSSAQARRMAATLTEELWLTAS
jgi:hypothetical protein